MSNKEYIVNENIKARIVNLVLPDGKMYGKINLKGALDKAREEELDLVQVSSADNGEAPTCKMIDFGKMIYKENKKKKKQTKEVVKEIKFSFGISDHDLEVKHKKILEFLQKRYKVKYVLELRGRELNKHALALEKMKSNLENFRDLATWKEPGIGDRSVVTVLQSLSMEQRTPYPRGRG